MTDTKETPRLRAALPRGLVDRDAADIAAAEAMTAKIRAVYERYGFEAVETPFIEFTDALGKFLPDQDRPNEGVFSFKDDDEQWLSLRYDLTAPLARYVAENYERLPKPYRSYRAGWVFRNEKPGPGRFRQFMQIDADTVGAASPAADAEMCMMAADCLEALGIKRGDYVIKVWNRRALDGVMDAPGIPPETRLAVLRSVDKRDRLGLFGVQELLHEGRRDESGDYTKGAGLPAAANNFVIGTLSPSLGVQYISSGLFPRATLEAAERAQEPPFSFDKFRDMVTARLATDFNGIPLPPTLEAGLNDLEQMHLLISSVGYDDRVKIDPSVVRGLEYYTGPVFEAELTFETPGDDGKPVRFGSVGGGGRYDGLVARFRGEAVPATGFSIGVSRLLSALRAIQSPIVASAQKPGPVVVAVLDRDHMADYQRLVTRLRDAGIAAELYLGDGKMNAQLKYADRRGSLCAVIQGSNERGAAGGPQVVIRDLRLGAELAKASKDRADYLELRQRAQFAAPEAELVARVREVLARSASEPPADAAGARN
ncbi:MAG: histidine--tRNA ligase [Roseiarcus sp.]|jgi:histidyl-tRNA synthetase